MIQSSREICICYALGWPWGTTTKDLGSLLRKCMLQLNMFIAAQSLAFSNQLNHKYQVKNQLMTWKFVLDRALMTSKSCSSMSRFCFILQVKSSTNPSFSWQHVSYLIRMWSSFPDSQQSLQSTAAPLKELHQA